MKRLFMFVCIAAVATAGCKKDSDLTPQESMVGTWRGEEAKVVIYEENGEDVASETTISLDSPNFAEATFKSDSTFTMELRLVTPLPVTEEREGRYEVSGSNLTLKIAGESDAQVPFTLKNNELKVTLGTPGVSILTYTFIRVQ